MVACIVCVKATERSVTVDESKSGREWARVLDVGETSVRKHRKHVLGGVATINSDAPVPAGESETHNPDGSASYVRYSMEPWGFDDYREFIRATGQDPDLVTFTWGWTSNPGGGFWNKLNNVRPIAGTVESIDLPSLYKVSARKPRPRVKLEPAERATVVVVSDLQIGKTGRRGGTPELLERLAEKRDRIDALLAERRPSRVVYLDGGDGFEGFENTAGQAFTNDLSLAQQMDCYSTEVWLFLETMHRHAPVDVAVVPSNHTAWRNGKQQLGRPEDDFGLFVHREVRKRAEAAALETTWHFPDLYDESLVVDVFDTAVGLVHGNQFAPGKAVDWWEGQTFGAQAVTRADVLVTGHYHTFGAGTAGKNPANQRERWWLGAPTLDNGSDWFRQIKGRDSDPGVLVFDVTPAGFDLGSLTIL